MRSFCLAIGTLLLAVIWTAQFIAGWRGSVTAHMLAHMAVVAVASPLMAVGLAPSIIRLKASTLIGLPIWASLVELVVVWGWHAPVARRWADGWSLGMAAEQASFLMAGLFLWMSCLAAGRAARPSQRAAGTVGLLLTSMHMTLLGALLALSPRPLYGDENVTCLGLTLTAAEDQQIGAVVMLLVGAASYLAGGVVLLSGLLADPDRRAA